MRLSIVAIRIYYDGDSSTPMADLKTMDGVCETIQWNDAKARKEFSGLISGYTFIYDERPKRAWNEW